MTQWFRFADYDFPNVSSFFNNFGNTLPAAEKLIGADGALDLWGFDRAPIETGQIVIRFNLTADTPAQMAAQRRAVGQLTTLGKRRFWWKPADLAYPLWTWARIQNNPLPQNADNGTDRLHPLTLHFQADDPTWYSNDLAGYFDDGGKFDDGGSFDSGVINRNLLNGIVLSYINKGNADTFPRFDIRGTSAGVTGFTIKRQGQRGGYAEILTYNGTIANNQTLTLDCGDLLVYYTGDTDESLALDRLVIPEDQRYWMRLEPGENIFEFYHTGATIAVMSLYYEDAYRL